MLLHTICRSPDSSNALGSCLRTTLPDAVILLLEDGVYCGCRNSQSARVLADSGLRIYAIKPDVAARGLGDLLAASIQLIDYPEFVALAAECHAVQNWT